MAGPGAAGRGRRRVRFHPGAAPALLGPPASALRDLRVGPGDLWGRAGRELAERVGEAASPAVGLGERQLRRRFLDGVGYGPKTLARVLRFQRLLALLTDDRAGRPTLAEAAALAGYADQAHMTAECTRLAGRSPAAIRAGR
jgi:AraC-like DNA-binding protein